MGTGESSVSEQATGMAAPPLFPEPPPVVPLCLPVAGRVPSSSRHGSGVMPAEVPSAPPVPASNAIAVLPVWVGGT